jgi:hypothetical protein
VRKKSISRSTGIGIKRKCKAGGEEGEDREEQEDDRNVEGTKLYGSLRAVITSRDSSK